MKKIRIGTRGSKLALIQTELVKDRIESAFSDIDIEIVKVSTKGDRNTDRPIAEIGGKGVFTDEINAMLTRGEIDIAVHSGKDIPTDREYDTVFHTILPREDAADLLIKRRSASNSLIEGQATSDHQINSDVVPAHSLLIGTSSPRRSELIKRMYPDCQLKLLRGNVDTRLRKLNQGEYDGIILAAAGVKRLGADLSGFDVISLDKDIFPPAGCQGIIASETVRGSAADELLGSLTDSRVQTIFDIERCVLKRMNAGCHDACAAHAEYVDDTGHIRLTCFFGGSDIISCSLSREDTVSMLKGEDTRWKMIKKALSI